ncbi:MAG: HD domain-containing protein [Methanocorpusculum sp.]|nr:HD domain-containing protein [Methanocorpusculum sp.]
MNSDTFRLLESYMLSCTADDTAHGADHSLRVLYGALKIAANEADVDYDCLIAACLLHDIGRADQLADPNVCHASAGAEKAKAFLLANGFSEAFAAHVHDCIETHRFRAGRIPATIEAKILFDADKLDVCGAIGIARTLAYKGQHGSPLYTLSPEGRVCTDAKHTFFHEYTFKLAGMYDRFYTQRGRELAAVRKKAAEDFYAAMLDEVDGVSTEGMELLEGKIYGRASR